MQCVTSCRRSIVQWTQQQLNATPESPSVWKQQWSDDLEIMQCELSIRGLIFSLVFIYLFLVLFCYLLLGDCFLLCFVLLGDWFFVLYLFIYLFVSLFFCCVSGLFLFCCVRRLFLFVLFFCFVVFVVGILFVVLFGDWLGVWLFCFAYPSCLLLVSLFFIYTCFVSFI